jgi:Ca2+:H+ antiporter
VGLAVLLIAAYGLGMLFSLKTHRELFASGEHGEAEGAPWPIGPALGILAGVTVLVALVSEVFVAPVLVLVSYVIGPTPMDLQFWPGAVMMIFIATITTSLVTNGGRSAWFIGVLPPRVQ